LFLFNEIQNKKKEQKKEKKRKTPAYMRIGTTSLLNYLQSAEERAKRTKRIDKRMHMVCDVVLLCLRLSILDSSVLKEKCCKSDLSKDRKDSMNAKSPNVINT
jgi:hypothetical protein